MTRPHLLLLAGLFSCFPPLLDPTYSQTPVPSPMPAPFVDPASGLPPGTMMIIDKEGRIGECRPPQGQAKSEEFDRLCDNWKKRQGKARAVHPIDPAQWVTLEDYPPAALADGQEGPVQVRLDVDTQGRVKTCTVLGSSGFPALDDGTCEILSRKARFKPRLDENGRPVEGSYIRAVNWHF